VLCTAREISGSAHPPPPRHPVIEIGSPMAGCCEGESVLVGARRFLWLNRVL